MSVTDALVALAREVGAAFDRTSQSVHGTQSTQSAQATRPAQPAAQAPAATRTPVSRTRNSTRVVLDVDVAHDGSPQELHRAFTQWALTNGRGTDAPALVDFLLTRGNATPVAWRARDYAGYRG